MDSPRFDLDPPGTLPFTAHHALAGHALNAFALGLRDPAKRRDFLADERGVLASAGLAADVQAQVLARDWTGLLAAGGHLHAVLKIAATVGHSLWHVGAHNAGVDVETLMAACPRRVDALPQGWPRASGVRTVER